MNVSSSTVSALHSIAQPAAASSTGKPRGGQDADGDHDGSTSAAAKPVVNTQGQSIGTVINVKA